MKRLFAFLIVTMMFSSALTHAQEVPAEAAAAMAQAFAAFGQMAEKSAADGAVDGKELKALLPAKDAFAGFKRVKAGTEITTAMGMKIVVAKAEFKALDDAAGFNVQFMDVGALGALAKMAVSMHEVDEETETGFRRTTKYGSYKAMEEYDSATKEGEVSIFPGERIAVEVSATGMDFDAIRQLVEKIELKKLAALKPQTASEAAQ